MYERGNRVERRYILAVKPLDGYILQVDFVSGEQASAGYEAASG